VVLVRSFAKVLGVVVKRTKLSNLMRHGRLFKLCHCATSGHEHIQNALLKSIVIFVLQPRSVIFGKKSQRVISVPLIN
jgi:hypothetical protein